ncbi:excalibur calcium-binding domain-containing protein [Novosphingobium kunmingense]|uniref:excalibur calcium-binding domain-containing protein n=1 Tax=Novosphingobium kunmingense TaxID=1211806 RepID=UPI000C2C0629
MAAARGICGASIAASRCLVGLTEPPGGLNGEGCHNNRKTGDYHCHRGKPQSAPPLRQSLFEARSGGAFRNCSEARAAGAAPVRRGDPGYGPHLDRDDDGVGCEPYRGR